MIRHVGSALLLGLTIGFLVLDARAMPPMVRARSDFRPNPAWVPTTDDRLHAPSDGKVGLVGEIVVMEGDSEIVSGTSDSDFGISAGGWGSGQDQLQQILQRFFTRYPDEFDGVVIWTTFWDNQNGGLAYHAPVKNDVRGIGQPEMNESAYYGSKGRLGGILNMNQVQYYMDNEGIGRGSSLYPTIGQEITHRWLAFLYFAEPSGIVPPDMLARQAAHWSALVDSKASVQDGVDWEDNGDGSFSVVGEFMSNGTFWELDQYAMGFRDASEVPPFFILREAKATSGRRLTANSYWRGEIQVGLTAKATRVDVTIDDIVRANGHRVPSAGAAQKDYRYAWILVTRPGETMEAARQTAEAVDTIRQEFETWFYEHSDKRGALCTRVTESCVRPEIRVDVTALEEASPGSNGNGVLEEGERFRGKARVFNAGLGTSAPVSLSAKGKDGFLTVDPLGQAALGEIGPAQDVVVELGGKVSQDAPCGKGLGLLVVASSGEAVITGSSVVQIGYLPKWKESFDTDGGWKSDPEGKDTAPRGRWEWGVPMWTGAQPQGGAGGGSDPAWVTGKDSGGDIGEGDLDEGVTTLESPPLDVSGIARPVLRFRYYVNTVDMSRGEDTTLSSDYMKILGSADKGVSWVELGRLSGANTEYLTAELPVAGRLVTSGGSLVVRFVIADDAPQTLTEAVIDDVELLEMAKGCQVPDPLPAPDAGVTPTTPDAGSGGPEGGDGGDGLRVYAANDAGDCGCRVGGRTGAGSAWRSSLLLLALGWIFILGRWKWVRR
ncbi:MAG: hypothetical protein HY698_06725 [Deltaproteobacteria bacterium]|nr:hypothetical protein [Deltaproteobacteria bacterium]